MTSPRYERAEQALYVISVAAELAGVHPQTLRMYERKGLLNPSRTSGNTRRYSERDIARLRTIQTLTQEGVNLAGAALVIALREELDEAMARVGDLESKLAEVQRGAAQAIDRVQRSRRFDLVPYEAPAKLVRRPRR